MGESPKQKETKEHTENRWFERVKLSRSLDFAPVHVSIDGQRKRLPVPQPSWWHLFTGWLSYHSIQIRWHIERRVARMFHRRWGAK